MFQATYFGIFSISSSDGEHGEKVGIGVTAMLAVAVLLLTVGDIVPRTQQPTPYIRQFLLILPRNAIACSLCGRTFSDTSISSPISPLLLTSYRVTHGVKEGGGNLVEGDYWNIYAASCTKLR